MSFFKHYPDLHEFHPLTRSEAVEYFPWNRCRLNSFDCPQTYKKSNVIVMLMLIICLICL
jgi:hypothetical protein